MVLLFLMMLLVTGDVVGRYCLNRPITGAIDVVEQMLVLMVFLALAYATAQKSHVIVNVVISRLSEKPRTILNCTTSFASLVIAALITWQMGARAWALLFQMFQMTQRTMTLLWPIGPFAMVAAVGAFFLCLELTVDFCTNLAQAAGRRLSS
jgi:TRAP-type C4-dicarboxylate transport system permease small subunit